MANARNVLAASAADFAETNPWLGDGEERIETDTRKSKTGPGYWNDLDYGAGQTGGSGASGVGDSAFYDDTAGMAATEGHAVVVLDAGFVTLAFDPNPANYSLTGTDLALNVDNTQIDVLTAGVYAIQLRAFVNIDPTDGDISCRINLTFLQNGGAGGDRNLIVPATDFCLRAPQRAQAFTFCLVANWTVWVPASRSLEFRARATRLDDSTGDIGLTASGATELLIRRVV